MTRYIQSARERKGADDVYFNYLFIFFSSKKKRKEKDTSKKRKKMFPDVSAVRCRACGYGTFAVASNTTYTCPRGCDAPIDTASFHLIKAWHPLFTWLTERVVKACDAHYITTLRKTRFNVLVAHSYDGAMILIRTPSHDDMYGTYTIETEHTSPIIRRQTPSPPPQPPYATH